MWYEDLQAWQQVREETVIASLTPASSGIGTAVFPLVGADPSRVILAVTAPPGLALWMSTRPDMPAFDGTNAPGIQVGCYYWATDLSYHSTLPINLAITGNVDPATGNVAETVTGALTWNWRLRLVNTVDSTRILTWHTHGALVGAAWYAVAAETGISYNVLTVRMPNRPCSVSPQHRGRNGHHSAAPLISQSNRTLLRRGRNLLNPYPRTKPKPPRSPPAGNQSQ